MTTPPAANRPPEHEERYRALRLIAAIIRIPAILVAVLGGLGVIIGAIVALGRDGGVGPALLVLVGGALYVAVISSCSPTVRSSGW